MALLEVMHDYGDERESRTQRHTKQCHRLALVYDSKSRGWKPEHIRLGMRNSCSLGGMWDGGALTGKGSDVEVRRAIGTPEALAHIV